MTIVGGLGTYLAGIANKSKGQVVIAYDTASGFTQWHLFVWDGSSLWIDVTNPPHVHTTNANGGAYIAVRIANADLYEYSEQLLNNVGWTAASSGTGATFDFYDDNTRVYNRHRTGTTNSGYSNSYKGGIMIDFDKTLIYQTSWIVTAVNNMAVIFGVGAEAINAAPNNNAKMGIEWCDAQANPNYYMMSASGSVRNLSDSTVALSANNMAGVKIVHVPADKLYYKFHNAVSINKSTNIPQGAIAYNNILRRGIKNNNGGSSNRDLMFFGSRLTGTRRGGEFPA